MKAEAKEELGAASPTHSTSYRVAVNAKLAMGVRQCQTGNGWHLRASRAQQSQQCGDRGPVVQL